MEPIAAPLLLFCCNSLMLQSLRGGAHVWVAEAREHLDLVDEVGARGRLAEGGLVWRVVDGALERLDRRVDAPPPRLVDDPAVALPQLLRLQDLLRCQCALLGSGECAAKDARVGDSLLG
jgi:hypothetical protein